MTYCEINNLQGIGSKGSAVQIPSLRPHGVFHSAWQITGLRDIDPTCLDVGKPESEDSFRSDEFSSWWAPIPYSGCEGESSNDFGWLRVAKDFPDIGQMIEVKNPLDNSDWLVLHSSRSWMRSEPDSENPIGSPGFPGFMEIPSTSTVLVSAGYRVFASSFGSIILPTKKTCVCLLLTHRGAWNSDFYFSDFSL